MNAVVWRCCIVFCSALLFAGCSKRDKEPEELVLDDYITEINGVYYLCECELHCGETKITSKGENYYANGRVKNTWALLDGYPDSLWCFYDSSGIKKLEILFDKGQTIRRITF